MSDEVKKKKPGRPKKEVAMLNLAVQGISNAPINKENILEIVYNNPKMFKKIFLLDKSYMVNEICMDFSPKSFIITSQNHTKTITKKSVFNCAQLNHYYCKEKISVDIKRDLLEKIFRNLDKSQYKITFILKEDFRKKIYLQIKDYELNSERLYDIEVIQTTERPNEEQFNNIDDYPVKFELPSKSFKRIINDFDVHSDTLTIRKNGTSPLQLTYDIVSNKVSLTESYLDEKKIHLKSTIAPDDILSISVPTSNIKPFSNSCIGDTVIMKVDKNRPLCLITKLDKNTVETKQGGFLNEVFICTIYVLINMNKY